MLKNYRLIATVLVFAASSFGAFAQTNQTDNYKNVLLNGKPAKLNLTTGEVTYTNGEIAKSRAAKKIKDSLLATRTEIKTNLLEDMLANSDTTQNKAISDSIQTIVNVAEERTTTMDAKSQDLPENIPESDTSNSMTEDSEVMSMMADKSDDNTEEIEDIVTSDFHVVKEGENLYFISKRYNTTLNELIVANRLETTLIKPGQNLRVRNFDFSEAEITWIVSRGDTLYSIAKKNNTTVDELIDLNGLSSSLIKIGQKLQVNQNSTLTKK